MTRRNRLAGVRSAQATEDDDRCPPGIAIAIGAVVLIAAALVAAALPPAPGPRLALLVIVVATFAAGTGDGRAALAVATLAWFIGNGFLINQHGELSWHGRIDTGFVISLLLGVSVGAVAGQIRTEWRAHRRIRPFEDLLQGAATPQAAAEPVPPAEAREARAEPETTERIAKER
jgi:MFS family permease